MANSYDVIVIGAGAMGSATAWWLARRGASTLLVEQFEQGHRRGSSHGGSRIFRLAYPDPVYVRLAQEALACWREAEDDTGVAMLDTTGAIDHGDERSLDRIASALGECNVRFERLTASAAAERFPGMRFASSAIVHSEGGRCLADVAVCAFQERAAELGCDVRFSAGRASLTVTRSGVSVALGDSAVTAPVAVVTAGAWAEEVLGSVVMGLPKLAVTQEQIAHFAARDPTIEWPSFIDYSATGAGMYGLRTPGEGIKVGRHIGGPPTTGDARDFAVDEAHTRRVIRYVDEWLPGLDSTPRSMTTCLYTTTPSEDFVIDRQGPIVVGSPCSGHGFKFTPVIGRMLADLAQGAGAPNDRFRLGRT
jgi:sarcosine oxidase